MTITVNTTKLAEFISEQLQGDCECRTLCYNYCGGNSCIESIELCIIDNLNNMQESEESEEE